MQKKKKKKKKFQGSSLRRKEKEKHVKKFTKANILIPFQGCFFFLLLRSFVRSYATLRNNGKSVRFLRNGTPPTRNQVIHEIKFEKFLRSLMPLIASNLQNFQPLLLLYLHYLLLHYTFRKLFLPSFFFPRQANRTIRRLNSKNWRKEEKERGRNETA